MSHEGCVVPDFCSADTLIIGCGNRLLGDDGFGPELVDSLRARMEDRRNVFLIDAGTGMSRLLFDIVLAERKPTRIIVADAMRRGASPGSVCCLRASELTPRVSSSALGHQEPTSVLLKELSDLPGIEVFVLAAEPERMPDEVSPGLSPAMRGAIGQAMEQICSLLGS